MPGMMRSLWLLPLCLLLGLAPVPDTEHHYLYVAEPGIRNYVEYGGVGVLVFDMDNGYRFVRRIPSEDVPAGAKRRRTSKALPPARPRAGST